MTPLPHVSSDAAIAFQVQLDTLLGEVNRRMRDEVAAASLIGDAPLALMLDNHRNHARLICAVVAQNAFPLLLDLLPWVYRVYLARGFSPDYFPAHFSAWRAACQRHLDPAAAAAITTVYDWLTDLHPDLLAQVGSAPPATPSTGLTPELDTFSHSLLTGDDAKANHLASAFIGNDWDAFERFLLDWVQPAMREIGERWARGAIRVAHEHIATATVSRVIGAAYGRMPPPQAPPRGYAIVSAAPDEHHQLGVWIFTTLLERRGWKTLFLGANTPAVDLLAIVREQPPDLVALSVTMPLSLLSIQTLLEELRAIQAQPWLMIGGLACSTFPSYANTLAADRVGGAANTAADHISARWDQRREEP